MYSHNNYVQYSVTAHAVLLLTSVGDVLGLYLGLGVRGMALPQPSGVAKGTQPPPQWPGRKKI